LAVRESGQPPGAPPDLARAAFKAIIDPDAPLMFFGQAVVAERATSKAFNVSSTLIRTIPSNRDDITQRTRFIVQTAPVCAALVGFIQVSQIRGRQP
jgi:hypothetical protein